MSDEPPATVIPIRGAEPFRPPSEDPAQAVREAILTATAKLEAATERATNVASERMQRVITGEAIDAMERVAARSWRREGIRVMLLAVCAGLAAGWFSAWLFGPTRPVCYETHNGYFCGEYVNPPRVKS